jgi:hypothetical protein
MRRSRRLPSKGSTRVKVFRNTLGLGPNIAVLALDISETGARLAVQEDLPPGHELEVYLEGPALQPFRCAARVTWSSKSEDGLFIIGVELHKPIPYPHLSALARG